jgi:hypothetical protein
VASVAADLVPAWDDLRARRLRVDSRLLTQRNAEVSPVAARSAPARLSNSGFARRRLDWLGLYPCYAQPGRAFKVSLSERAHILPAVIGDGM